MTELLQKAKALRLYGLVSRWDEIKETDWVKDLITWEEAERSKRSLERRMHKASLGQYKPMCQFDWDWPKKCDREAIEEWMKLGFIKKAVNLVICGPNGAGKSTIASNIAYQAVIQGYTVLFTTAGNMLNSLAVQDGNIALQRRFKYYSQPHLLIIDEVGYLSYSNKHADLLFEIIARRYEAKSIIVTTNKQFSDWGDIFPNASCVVSLIDRLVHHSEIVNIEADSYRLKEAREQSAKRKAIRGKK